MRKTQLRFGEACFMGAFPAFLAWSILVWSASADGKEHLTEKEIIEHFHVVIHATDSYPGEPAWESGRILNRNSEVVLPVLEKEFRENLDKPLYLASIVGFFQSKWNKGDKTILLDDLRAHIPRLEGNEEDWPLVRAGLVFLGNYGDERDMLLVDSFADHEHGLVREAASLARKAFERRRPDLVVPVLLGGLFVLIGGAAGIILHKRHRRRTPPTALASGAQEPPP